MSQRFQFNLLFFNRQVNNSQGTIRKKYSRLSQETCCMMYCIIEASFHLFISQISQNIFGTFTEEILNGKLHFLCSVNGSSCLNSLAFQFSLLISFTLQILSHISLKSGSHLPKKKIFFICFNDSPSKRMKNAFYFILKARFVLFVLKIF